MTDHTITPPRELVKKWIQEADGGHNPRWEEYEQDIADRAAQWGADQELEACVGWLNDVGYAGIGTELRAARRPKPPSLKEQALAAAAELEGFKGVDIIRRALEALPDD